jgi:hypothetical protein
VIVVNMEQAPFAAHYEDLEPDRCVVACHLGGSARLSREHGF